MLRTKKLLTTYNLLLLLFPVSFLLHGINENFGLIESLVLVKLLGIYLAITIIITVLSKFIINQYHKAVILSFFLLLIYFFFGVFKDFANDKSFIQPLIRYLFIVPALIIIISRLAFLPQYYISQLQYTNTVIQNFADAILASYTQEEFVIIIQGDHGFKFNETDTLYDKESCNILYAVYCSDKDYSGWYNSMSSVNGFRILFNKYFKTSFPVLPDKSHNLYYRIK